MAKKIYLEGGGDTRKGENLEIDKEAIINTDNKFVYVLDMTTDDKKKIASYRAHLEEHFKKVGAEKIRFSSNSDSSDEVMQILNEAGIIYLPGGDPLTLLKNLKENKLENSLRDFKGVIIGNSAGAALLSKKAFCLGHGEEVEEIEGRGFVDLVIDVHYSDKADEELLRLSKDDKIYAISERGAIIINEDGSQNYFGEIFKFSKGEKIKVN